MKRKLAIILSLVLLVSMIAACGGDSGGPATTPPPSTDGGGGGGGGGGAVDPVAPGDTVTKFTFYDEDGNRAKPWNTPIALEITRLTGIELDFQYPIGGADVMIPLMTASGDYPDLIYGKGTGSDQLLDAGALLLLDNYIANSRYMKDFYGDLLGRMRVSEADPHIYTAGGYGINDPKWEVSAEMGVQLAILEEFGYPMIRTIYDVGDLLERYKELYPEIDGRPTLGFSLNNADNWRYIIDVGNPSGFIAGNPDHGEWIINQDTLETYIKYIDPDLKEYYKFMNDMWNKGLIDPDCWTQTHEDWEAKIATGRVMAIVTPNWMVNSPEQSLRQNGMDERTYSRMPITYNANLPSMIRYDFGWSGGWGVGITTACNDPDKAFAFLDWMCSDESQILRYWGIEGEHYEYIDGKRVQFDHVREARTTDPDYGNAQGLDWAYPFPERGNGALDPTGNTYTTQTPDWIMENYSDAAKKALAAYGKNMWADFFPAPWDLPVSKVGAAWQIAIPLDSTLKDFESMVQHTLMPRMIPEAIMAAPDQFDAKWQDFVDAVYAAGAEQYNVEFTELVRGTGRLFGTWN